MNGRIRRVLLRHRKLTVGVNPPHEGVIADKRSLPLVSKFEGSFSTPCQEVHDCRIERGPLHSRAIQMS
jgi:hypothetical protein